MLSVACIARRRRMHCRGSSDANAAGTAAAPAGREEKAGTQGRPPLLPQDAAAGSAPDSGTWRRRCQTVRADRALAPGARRRQQGRRTTGSVASVEAAATAAAGDARGEVEEDDASAPSSSEASSSVLCAVCLEEVVRSAAAEEAEVVEAITLPCSHAYHPGCVLPWLAVHRACPCCRATVSSPEN